jgi:hypothetical protein
MTSMKGMFNHDLSAALAVGLVVAAVRQLCFEALRHGQSSLPPSQKMRDFHSLTR